MNEANETGRPLGLASTDGLGPVVPAAWLFARRYGSGLSFAKPAAPADDCDLEFHATRPLFAVDAEHMARSLFEHIKHGDEAHREWLRVQALAWVRGYFGA